MDTGAWQQNGCQVAPSADHHASISPAALDLGSTCRTRSQIGADPLNCAALALAPPVAARYWNAMPLEGDTIASACFEFASSVSRIITPAFAQTSVLPIERTRAVIISCGSSTVAKKKKLSLIPQMSAPEPLTV